LRNRETAQIPLISGGQPAKWLKFLSKTDRSVVAQQATAARRMSDDIRQNRCF
jgi:hypothetical protein